MPWINGVLMVGVLTLVFAFRSSGALAYAFGMAVTGTITITTAAVPLLARTRWRTPLWLVMIGGGTLLLIDLLFVAANLTKVVHGAWLPLLIGIIAFTVMTTWHRGREIVTRAREEAEGPLRRVHRRASATATRRWCACPAPAVFLNRGKETAPLAMRANVEHNHVLHEHVVIMSIETLPVPRVPDTERIAGRRARLRRATESSIVTAHFGYMENAARLGRAAPPRPEADRRQDRDRRRVLLPVQARTRQGSQADDGAVAQAAVHRDVLHHRRRRRTFGLPRDRTVIMGSRIEV